MKNSSILMKSLALGLLAGLAVFGVFYGFFISHRELAIEPSIAKWLGLCVFFLGFIISWIYFQFGAKR